MNKKTLETISAVLLLIGGLFWGFIGVFDYDMMGSMFGDMGTSALTRIVYVLIGLSALYRLYFWFRARGK
jgi:uncharacterized membrane protein YuzA (DUF378 family)